MPLSWKDEIGNDRIPQRTWLKMPAIGMESEFNVWLDGVEIIPEDYWKHPTAFIEGATLHRTKTSTQIPSGGAVYFDRGVIEVVTPVIEIAPGCTARVVRNLWDQIHFVRNELTKWGNRTGHDVRLKAYSCHYNVSFELKKREQTTRRNIKKLALLLAYLLPVPVMLLGGNRRSTGVGVRPRGNRIEITVDFTPDPGLMIATCALIVGIVRDVISWPSYELSLLDDLKIPIIEGVIPGKHTTRKGWLTKDFHYPQSPYTSDIDARIWKTRLGQTLTLREIGQRTAYLFRRSIRELSDPFSTRLLFAVLDGRALSMLELEDRPAAYEDVGRLCHWGEVIPELKHLGEQSVLIPERVWKATPIEAHVEARERERAQFGSSATTPQAPLKVVDSDPKSPAAVTELPQPLSTPKRAILRKANGSGRLLPRSPGYVDRRMESSKAQVERRRRQPRRKNIYAVPFPDRRLTRSAYESVFLKLVSGSCLQIGPDLYKPVGMKGWYHAVFRRESDGRERLLSIDQLLGKMEHWK
ncbi:MAG TPA: hypothetical protein VHL58_19640 [Thermoanaerobaculia bacterium]|nr:hypothetical protein [Thermoanaerobaculia bacterium]